MARNGNYGVIRKENQKAPAISADALSSCGADGRGYHADYAVMLVKNEYRSAISFLLSHLLGYPVSAPTPITDTVLPLMPISAQNSDITPIPLRDIVNPSIDNLAVFIPSNSDDSGKLSLHQAET